MKEEKISSKKKSSLIKTLSVYFKPYKWHFIICSIVIFIANMTAITTGYLNGRAIESVINGVIKDALVCFLIYFIIEITIELLNRAVYYVLNKDQLIISRKIGFDTYKKVLKLPAYAFEDLSSGEIINRVTNDTETVVGCLEPLISCVSRIASSLIILIYIFIKSWILGLEITIFLVIYACVVKHYTKKLKKYTENRKKNNDKFSAISTESVRGIREIKTLGIFKNLTNHVSDLIKKILDSTIKEYKVSTRYDLICIALAIIVECGTFVTCVLLVYYEQISVTFFVAMTYYIYRFTFLINFVQDFSKTYEQLFVSLGRINEILGNELYDDVHYGDVELKDIKGIIEFKNVTFNYKNEETLLDNFNVTFDSSKKIAIVGASGEGKSTLFNLITRIFDPVKGSIYLDGVDIKELSEDTLRNGISIIRQEPFIFNKTIKENFTIVDKNVTLDTIRKYCKMASIDDYIMSLPKKYDTILGEGGVNLSGGQKQRIAIARTLLKKSKVVLFDEATSALDNESQEAIKYSIDKLSHDHTVIIIAHRLSTIIDADIIYVMKKGKVLMSGTHKYLMKNCKYYQKLYTTEEKVK